MKNDETRSVIFMFGSKNQFSADIVGNLLTDTLVRQHGFDMVLMWDEMCRGRNGGREPKSNQCGGNREAWQAEGPKRKRRDGSHENQVKKTAKSYRNNKEREDSRHKGEQIW